jgi:hypothetical protein
VELREAISDAKRKAKKMERARQRRSESQELGKEWEGLWL